jgi:hypothetical protein
VYCFDTDPVNATFAQYRSLKAEHINVIHRGSLNEKRFDALVERLCQVNGVSVIDTGATTFIPLWNYILENEIIQFLVSRSRRVLVHSVVAGGQALSDTLNGFHRLAETARENSLVVWLNEYFGEVSKDGKSFDQFRVAEEHASKLIGTVLISERNRQTFGDDVRQMLEQRFTFEEAIQSSDFTLVSKQRLAIVCRDLFQQIEQLGIV